MDLYLFCYDKLDTLIKNISEYVRETIGEKVKIREDESDDYYIIYISCSLYCIVVESSDTCDMKFIKEDYGAEVNVCLEINLYGNYYDAGLENVSKMIKRLADIYKGDLIFLDDCSVLKYRKTKDMYIDNEFWNGLLDD